MHLYHAAVYTSSFGKLSNIYARLTDSERVHYNSIEHILESYHYIHNQRRVEAIRTDSVKVFLDSGAFSAFSLGATIDIGAYCDYILRNQDIILFPSVLDAIGDPDGTWRNQSEMERRGVRPLPCFHYGEPTEILDYYAANYEYITIGGMVPISTAQLRIWLDRIWEEHLTNADGTAKVKVHGFGLTSLDLMCRYPWYSVDSSTWQAWGSMGQILLPRNFSGQLQISDKSTFRKTAGQHYDNFVDAQREALANEITELGGDVARLRTEYYVRWAWNIWAFPEYARRNGHIKRFDPVEQRLF